MKFKLIFTAFICILTFNFIKVTCIESQNYILLRAESSIPDIGY